MVQGPIPLCLFCKEFIRDFECNAFPGGIPQKVLTSEKDHRKAIGGEERREGAPILFNPVDTAAEERAAAIFD
jgi:hypothetical protein